MNAQYRLYRSFFKRFLDLSISAFALILLSPLMLISALIIALESGRPVLFKQQRIGFKGKVFQIYKFRSMVQNAEHTGSGVYSGKDDARVTRFGKFLRASSIVIGPRPPLTYHPWTYDKYTKEQLHMFDARPGITGWAQIHGRKGVEWHERIKLNNWYVDHLSFGLDCKILFVTIFKVFSNSDNVNVGATVETKQ